MASDRPDLPDRIGIDAHGYGWRAWGDSDLWSMVPQNPDNEPVPEPVTWYVPEDARLRDQAERRNARILDLEAEIQSAHETLDEKQAEIAAWSAEAARYREALEEIAEQHCGLMGFDVTCQQEYDNPTDWCARCVARAALAHQDGSDK